jgi:sigma-B regulation protein RsbU (phosphoserine phosphatase)
MKQPHPNAGPFPQSGDVAPLLSQIDALQAQILELQREIEVMQRRDATLNRYMQKIDEEMRLAARLQFDFLPKTLPDIGRVKVSTLFRPAGYVSGDLYDCMRLDERHIGFYVADAVGHGMPAALLTMFMKNALQTKQIVTGGYRLMEPDECMRQLNRALLSQQLSHATFATALYGMIDAESLEVRFAKGGHPSPLLLRSDGTLIELEADGGLLGIFDDETFEPKRAQLEPGDRLFIYSDGIELAFAEDQVVDSKIWRRELQRRHHFSTDELLADFSAHLDREDGSLMPRDDLTLVIIEAR